MSPCNTFPLEEQHGVKGMHSVPLRRCARVCPDLRGSEAEGSCDGVGLVPVLQHQPSVLRQGQVVASGQVPQSEGLTPADVAPTPAVEITSPHYIKKTHEDI